ncbi:hypothetical protein FACS189429_0480 [Bacteroidia bacterium]|nr:hypothetical protein FACS189429_0480 [Bacteroidia bacterium]GHV45583.1 hypothetical protein FACS1894180_8240 [Bacteroidia bacterium]
MFASVTMFGAKYQLPLDNLSSGWESSYDAATHTITFDGEWKGRGWWLEADGVYLDASAYTKVEVKFQPVAFQVKVIVEYNGYDTDYDAFPTVAAGETTISVTLDADKKSAIKQIYIQSSAAGTLTLTDAYLTDGADDPVVVPASILDFEADAVGAAYPYIAWTPAEGQPENANAVVAANPSGTGNALHFTSANWNSYPKFAVTLPDNKTVGDIEKITLDIYFGEDGSSDQNSYKHFDLFVGTAGASFTPNIVTFSTGDLVASDARGVWLSKQIVIPEAFATYHTDLLTLNAFDLGLGLLVESADYYLDNISFILKEETAVHNTAANNLKVFAAANTLFVSERADNVQIFDLNGKLAAQAANTASVNIAALPKGMYVVKIALNNQTFVHKFVK